MNLTFLYYSYVIQMYVLKLCLLEQGKSVVIDAWLLALTEQCVLQIDVDDVGLQAKVTTKMQIISPVLETPRRYVTLETI